MQGEKSTYQKEDDCYPSGKKLSSASWKGSGLEICVREIKLICCPSLGCLTYFKLIVLQAFCSPSIGSDLPDKAVPKSGTLQKASILLLLLYWLIHVQTYPVYYIQSLFTFYYCTSCSKGIFPFSTVTTKEKKFPLIHYVSKCGNCHNNLTSSPS